MSSWDIYGVSSFIENISFGENAKKSNEYAKKFINGNVDGNTFLVLSDQNLINIGVDRKIHGTPCTIHRHHRYEQSSSTSEFCVTKSRFSLFSHRARILSEIRRAERRDQIL